ncbi:hypothetical protein AUP68_10915 [Ilyonectria robusta]
MADRTDTQFVPGVPFNCVGKIVGLLDHSLMVAAPPTDEKDYVFIVVPDSWTFPDKSTPPNKRPAISASPSSQSSSNNPAPKRLRRSSVTTATSPIIAGSPVSPLTSVDSDENDNHEGREVKGKQYSRSPDISATLRSSVRPNMRSSTTEPGGRNKRHPTKKL